MENNSKIVGRAKEITKLNKILESSESEFLAVYGRRRVGKTFLIRQHFKSQIVFDFTGAKDASRSEQLANFFAVYLNKTQGKKETTPPKTWFEAFGYLANYLEGLKPTKTKHVVFIDEMPWIDSPKSAFVPALEYFWNQHAAKLENVLLVACGSASSWIRKKLISARGGLYNRVSQRIKLSPFNLQETELFLKSKGINLPQYQVLELYMAMGGIPFYLNEVVKGQSSTQIINNLCFSKEGLLFDEYAQLYYSIFKNLSLIMTGNTSVTIIYIAVKIRVIGMIMNLICSRVCMAFKTIILLIIRRICMACDTIIPLPFMISTIDRERQGIVIKC